jgi:hypothetical protein
MGFLWQEVQFILAPTDWHQDVRGLLDDDGPGRGGLAPYDCPVVDPNWPGAQIQEAIDTHARRQRKP